MVFQTRVALIGISPIMLIAAATTEPGSIAGAATYTVALTGQEQVEAVPPAGIAGDQDGSGQVRLTVSRDMRRLCYDFTLSGLATPLMAHIHRGASAHNGPSVVTLFTGPGGNLHDCVVWTPKRLAEIVADPSSFYVSLSTTEYPDGALRGQLHG